MEKSRRTEYQSSNTALYRRRHRSHIGSSFCMGVYLVLEFFVSRRPMAFRSDTAAAPFQRKRASRRTTRAHQEHKIKETVPEFSEQTDQGKETLPALGACAVHSVASGRY